MLTYIVTKHYLRLLADDGAGWGDEGCDELALLTWRVLFRFGDESGVETLEVLLDKPWSFILRRAEKTHIANKLRINRPLLVIIPKKYCKYCFDFKVHSFFHNHGHQNLNWGYPRA